MKAATFENLTNGPMEGAHARVRPGRMRRPRKLKQRPELELGLEYILIKLAMSLLPKPMICVLGGCGEEE